MLSIGPERFRSDEALRFVTQPKNVCTEQAEKRSYFLDHDVPAAVNDAIARHGHELTRVTDRCQQVPLMSSSLPPPYRINA